MDVVEHNEFQKDLKSLSKKYPDFDRSYNLFKKVIKDDKHFNQVILRNSLSIANTGCQKKIFYKFKKFKLANMKGNTIRVIFFIVDNEIHLIEIYCKNKQENHSLNLIKDYCNY